MTRRYTGAEALALKAAATAGPLTVCAFPPGASYPHATTVQAPDGDVAWCELFAHAANAALFAASHDLADSLAAVEAERDALWAYFDASQELSATRQAQRKEWERGEGPASYEADDAVQAARTALNDAREAALSALREAVPG